MELESAPLARELTEEGTDDFSRSLLANRRIAGAAPSADLERRVLELRTNVDASGPANALAMVEVAFEAAAAKARLSVDVILANVWLDDERKAGG